MDAFKQPRGAIFQWLLSSTWLLGLMLGGAGVLAFLQVQAWSERNEFARLDDLATRQLDLHVAALESELHRHADLPSLMSVNPDVDALLAQAGHPSKALQERASRALANAAGRTGSREIFVVDRSDTVLATSDWFAPSSLLGSPLPGISCAAVTSGRARGFLFNPKTEAVRLILAWNSAKINLSFSAVEIDHAEERTSRIEAEQNAIQNRAGRGRLE